MQIRLLTLGTLRCYAGAAELEELPAQRLRCAVLLYLAVERDVTREAAASLLWPERDDERARHALSQKLYELRQLLGDGWLQGQVERVRVTPAVEVDALEFEAAAQRGDLEHALSVYHGEFLAGFYIPESKNFEGWVDRHRSRLARLHRKARKTRMEQCVASGNIGEAIAHARRWVELEPQEDDAQHRLIELLAATNNRAEAIRQYESYERALQAEQLRPLEHTRELIARVRQSSTAPQRDALDSSAGDAGTRVVQAGMPANHERSTRSRPTSLIAVGLTALLLTLGGAGWWTAWQHNTTASQARSIAVLPFLNLSTDPAASQYLSDGIADELITALSLTDSLQVAARTSSFRFKDKDVSVRTIADSLGVSLVLEGSVRKEGNRLRVTARLVNVADGYQLWSGAFDRDDTDALSVQVEIANAIVDALRIRLGDPERARLAIGGTRDPQAHELFLRGRYLLHRGARAAISGAIASFDSAIARDPRYALAYAHQAEAYVIAAATRELPHAAAMQRAKSAAQRAIQLAPTLSEAHAALGRAELEAWNWDAAEREARLAIQLEPRNASAHVIFTRVLLVRGRAEDAVREAALAARLEPLSATTANNYAEALRAARQYERSAQIYHKALELEPDLGRQNLAKVYIERAMYDSALVQFDAAVAAGAPRMRDVPLLWTAYVRARAGQHAEALALLEDFRNRQPQGPNAYMIAALYLAIGDRTRALELAELGVSERSQPAWRQLPWDPIWDPLRHDERFLRLLRQLGL